MCNLIPRLLRCYRGKDNYRRHRHKGRHIKIAPLVNRRCTAGCLPFSGTVFDNIEYGKPGASREEVIEAAKAAGAHEFISSLPMAMIHTSASAE